MAKAKFIQSGELATVKAAADVAYHGVVVIGSKIGIARHSAKAGDMISCAMEGVFELPKKASEALTQGTVAYYTEDGVTATAEGGTPAGTVWEDASADAETVRVKINA